MRELVPLLYLFGLAFLLTLMRATRSEQQAKEGPPEDAGPKAEQLEARFRGWGYSLHYVEPERSPISLHEVYAEAGGRILAKGTGMSRRGALLALERDLAGVWV